MQRILPLHTSPRTSAIAWGIVVVGVIMLALFAHPNRAVAQADRPATVINSNIITNTTWTEANSPYELTTSIDVLEGVALTIDPGVVVRASQSTELEIRGKLNAIGTSAKPILFTGSTAQAGWWYGISFNGTSVAPLSGSTLEYVTVEHSGRSNYGNINLYYATVEINHSTLRNSSGLGIRGLAQGFANIADSAITNNGGVALYFSDGSVRPLLSNLTINNNGSNVIEFGGGILNQDYTWRALGVPYVFGSMEMAVGTTLTIEAGVEARFTQSADLDIRGKILALGTVDKPILFTGTTAQAGWWYGISLNGTPPAPLTGSTFDYVTIEHSGRSDYSNLNFYYASATINHCNFRNGSASGLRGQSQGSATISDSSFTDNGNFPLEFQDGSVLPLLSNLTMSGNGNNVIRFGGGIISADYTWRALGVPYQFDSMEIAAGATLTIEAGVEARFTQSADLDVRGKILALGSAAKPILLTGTLTQPGYWYGVALNGTSLAPLTGSHFEYVTIEASGRGGYGNLNLYYATATIARSHFRKSSASGLRGLAAGNVILSYSSFTDNAHYPIQFVDGSVDPQMSNLVVSGNGTNAIAFAHGVLTGDRIWRALGVPYIFDSVDVPAGSTLTIEPGVEARFTQFADLEVRGRLIAIGSASAPITFTAATTAPVAGWWYGISVNGYSAAQATAEFDYVTVEYSGRSNYANVNVNRGQVAIRHTLLHRSSANGMTVGSGSSVTVEASRIIDNANYAIQNISNEAGNVVNASNNYWGAANGPTADGECNPGGTGGKVSVKVAFKPFLTAIDQKPAPLLPGEARIITISPRRWFVPADGLTRAFVQMSLHDGNGKPLPGRKLQLSSSLGSVVSGGITDAKGETLAYVTSDDAGDALLSANLDVTACESAKTPTAKITFTAQAASELDPEAEAPYFSERLTIDPEPIIRGVPTRLSAKLTNPNDFPILVDATFAYVQSSIGLAFGPVGEVLGKEIPAKGTVEIAIVWTPAVSGHYCVQLTYSSRRKEVTASDGNAILQAGKSQRNLNVYPGPLGSQNEKESLKKADLAFKVVSKAPGTKQLPVQKFIIGKWWNWIKDTASDISKNLGGDPPRQDYRTIATAERISLPPIVADGQISPARAAAINAVTEALLDANASGLAATISLDRYGGAAAAYDLQWTSLQSGALLYHKQEMAKALLVAADRIDALRALAISEGTTSIPITADEVRAYQQELAANGFSAQEIADAKLAGLSDAQIEANKQQILTTKPEDAAGDLLVNLEAWATAYRNLGNAILFPPMPSFSVSGGGGGLTQATAASADATPDNLARVFTTVGEFQLGNPLSTTATIDLVVRRVDLPSDWFISTVPVSVTLAPGEQTTVKVNIIPGGAAIQGATTRVAVEGYAGNELLGGVVMDVLVPTYAPFDGKLRVYLPLVAR